MKVISAKKIRDTVARLSVRANIILRPDVLSALRAAYRRENNRMARGILAAVIQNALIAKRERLAICQDTGLPTVFLEIGQEARVSGDLKAAVNKGIEQGYRQGYLRNSVVRNPLSRGRPVYSPAVIHTVVVKGRRIKVTVLPKGFGCENKSRLKMFVPTAKISEIKGFILEAVRSAGADACPPYIVGVGIGGSADYAMLLAKKSLLRKITSYKLRATSCVSRLEQDLLKEINSLNIGPMGLGGRTTALAVHIEIFPTHISGLPVAVNISCHALRSATKIL